MIKFLITFAVSFVAINLFYWAYCVANNLKRIADALEDLVDFTFEEDEEESEVCDGKNH